MITMKDVMTANCHIPNAKMLTSNHCAALARELSKLLAAPVPPAGDVEVLMDGVLDEMSRRFDLSKRDDDHMVYDDTQIGVEFAIKALRPEVTRLTAELDTLKAENSDYKSGQERYEELCESQRNSIRSLQSELTKAREFLVHIKKCLIKNKEYAPLSHQELDGLIGHSPSASCRNECRCLWCHQSAPAAKGNE